jgi:hypothetical protein
LFHSARWKAYLRSLQDAVKDTAEDAAPDKHQGNIYHIFHSQPLWFLREDPNQHGLAAQEYLSRCDALLGECTAMVDALEETLANTPKPSEVLDWSSIW